MKKQFLTVLLALLLACVLCSVSLAEDALAKAAAGTLEVLTETEDGAIYRYTAPNGQAIYFNSDSAEEDEDAVTRAPVVRMEDVNFDGVDDLVVITAIGASNDFSEFYVWDGTQYVYVPHYGTVGGLANVTLDAARGYVISSATNGYAGLLREVSIYRWSGTTLQLVRKLVADTKSEWVQLDDGRSGVLYDSETIVATIRDYQTDTLEGEIVWQKECSLADADSGPDFDQEMNEALWDGL